MLDADEQIDSSEFSAPVVTRAAGTDVGSARRAAARFGGEYERGTLNRTLRRFVRRYGWRAFAVPVLAIITVAALMTTRSPHHPTPAAAVTHHPASTTNSVPPSAQSKTVLKSDTPTKNASLKALKSAALPPGPSYTKVGDGTYRMLKGTSPVVGHGPLHTYAIEVENGVTGINLTQFADTVVKTLSDPRSWSGHGVSLQRVDSGQPGWYVTLTSSMTVRKLCGYTIPVETSCYDPAGSTSPVNRVVINDSRWVRGAMAYVGDVQLYRVYMINHEDGHALGHEHAHQCLSNGMAPAMMQQTIGLTDAATGKLCTANAWPYPPGVKDAPGVEAPDTPQNSEFRFNGD